MSNLIWFIISFILSLFCGIVIWYLYLKKKKFKEWGKDFIYRCPRCKSTNLGYLCSLSNYIEVFHYNNKPKYSYSFVCHDCDLMDSQDKLIKENLKKEK